MVSYARHGSMRCGLVLMLNALVSVPAWAQADQPGEARQETRSAEAQGVSNQGVAGRVSVVEQDVWIIFAEEPSQHFHRARADFWENDTIGAAKELLKGAAYLKLAADTAGGEVKDALMASVRHLDLLAYNVQMGGTLYVTDFDRQFAQAEAAMADYFFRRAQTAWEKKDIKNTGINLKITSVTLENAWGWTGEKPTSDTITVIKETQELASRMVGGAGWVEEQVTVEIDRVGAEVKKIKKSNRTANLFSPARAARNEVQDAIFAEAT